MSVARLALIDSHTKIHVNNVPVAKSRVHVYGKRQKVGVGVQNEQAWARQNVQRIFSVEHIIYNRSSRLYLQEAPWSGTCGYAHIIVVVADITRAKSRHGAREYARAESRTPVQKCNPTTAFNGAQTPQKGILKPFYLRFI